MRTATALAAVATGLVAWSAAAPAAPTPEKVPPTLCAGTRANVVGTDGPDVIRLQRPKYHRHPRLVVAAGGGPDEILGTRKRDVICGGRGEDSITAGGGSDRIIGGGGSDRVRGGRGGDVIDLTRGRDRAAGGGGSDVIRGGREADVISAGAGPDLVLPGGAKDTASGGSGRDRMYGARGDDRLAGGSGADEIAGQIGSDRLRGGAGADGISGARGRDRLRGGSGGDALDGGPGPDDLAGGSGEDSIRGGEGGDSVNAGRGADRVLGGAGGDLIDGDQGADRLYGQLVDDELYGGDGPDVISGGQGVDDLRGGAGDDLVRGDANVDYHWGDAGNDTVSYATATPPGPRPGVSGALVNLRTERALDDPLQPLVHRNDGRELVRQIENVIGSDFDDELTGAGGGARGLGGAEACSGFSSSGCDLEPAGAARVSLDADRLDPGVLVRGAGGAAAESFTLNVTAGAYVVDAGGPVLAGPGCESTSATQVTCPKPAAPIGYATLYGAGGEDQLALGPGFPDPGVAILDGGEGSDGLRGAGGAEILIGGPSGADRLDAAGGDDALFSGPGGDVLLGGEGSDQLVTSAPCDGHDFSGGGGTGDIAGFGQTLDRGVVAKLGGPAFDPADPACRPTSVRADNEILEGTQNADVLYGDARDNPLILGNEGDDRLYGGAGGDVLRGEHGQDAYFGGGGRDLLYAFDRARDASLRCGAGGNRVVRDAVDPPARGCARKKGERKGEGRKPKRKGKRPKRKKRQKRGR